MIGGTAVLKYRTTRVANLDPRRQVLALYNLSIQLSKQAAIQLHAENLESALERLDQCGQCVGELQAALNVFKGQEIAVNLWRLYEFARRCVERAGEERDERPLEDVLFILETLRDGWMQVIGLRGSKKAVTVRTYLEPVLPGSCC